MTYNFHVHHYTKIGNEKFTAIMGHTPKNANKSNAITINEFQWLTT